MSLHYCRKLLVTLSCKMIAGRNSIYILADDLYCLTIPFRNKDGFFQGIFRVFRKVTGYKYFSHLGRAVLGDNHQRTAGPSGKTLRSEEHTSELQSREKLV